MTWLALALLAALVLLPVLLATLRPPRPRGRAEADRALYAAQIAELDTQRAEGRLDEAAHRAALVEVQRRLLNAPAPEESEATLRPAPALLLALALIPAAAVGTYLWRGTPGMPSATLAQRNEAVSRDDTLIATLRERLARADINSEMGRQGWILVGNAERNRGRFAEAAKAWTRALSARFDPGLAGDLAEVEIERGALEEARRWLGEALAAQPGDPRLRFLSGMVEARAGRPENARATWRALLADAPADAPWRELVEARLRALP
ncbi:c-type cytochrome biogenesis protein CcmI [Sabulicella glaciei]|uniref:C-type cytochrome biogenesis protein CcmI n=1 Tax=Sabulicella glaciei TaxID=2984948 RepID=A0ABT3NY23_9PROT|nr:c-type cytochrome biogenesis protein CcmI [Roseococcus sp. MDT2-1-1]